MHNRLLEIIQADCQEVIAPAANKLEKLKNQLVYITGGSGFIGTWLTEAITFLNDNFNFNTSLILVSRSVDPFKEKTPHLAARRDVSFISADVRNIFEMPGDVSYVIHAAATPDNRQHVSDPLGVMETITKGTSAVIDASVRLNSLKKILNISSGQIYGKQGEIEAISEHYSGSIDCNTITSVYPEAKRYAETVCCAYWSLFKIPIVTARPFSFIGPYQRLDKPWAINNFIRDALRNKTIRIIGNGEPLRSYMYPSDMALWLLRILIDGKPAAAYNVGSPEGISLKDLAYKIKDASHAISDINIQNMNDDRSRFLPDVTLSRETFDLNIKVTINEAVTRSIRWFKTLSTE